MLKSNDQPFASPWKSDHWGIVVQDLDLTLTGETLTHSNREAAVKRQELTRAPERFFFTTSFTGRAGNLMFEYAALLGFARRFRLGALVPSALDDSQAVPAATMFREFGAHMTDALTAAALSPTNRSGVRLEDIDPSCVLKVKDQVSNAEDLTAYCRVDKLKGEPLSTRVSRVHESSHTVLNASCSSLSFHACPFEFRREIFARMSCLSFAGTGSPGAIGNTFEIL